MPLSDRDRRTLKIGGIVAGVLLLGVLLMQLLGGGDGQETVTPLPPTGGGTSSPTPSVTPTPTYTASPVAIFTGRDPFSVPPGFPTTTSGPTSGTTSPTGTSTSPTGTSTSPTGTSTSPTTPPPTAPGGGSSATMGGHQVVLLDVYSVNGVGHADVTVDGAAYHPAVGERFGPNQQFRLTNVSGSCATILFGDESHTFCITPQK